MKKKILVGMACLALVMTTACGKSKECVQKLSDGKEVVASFKGEDITAEDLYEKLKKSYGADTLIEMALEYVANEEIETTEEMKTNAQQTVDYYVAGAESYGVDLATLLQSSGVYGIETEEELLDYIINNSKISMAVEKYVEDQITDEEVQKYYDENYSKQVKIRLILTDIEKSDKDGKEALETANKVLEELKKAESGKVEEKFEALAKEYSDDASYSNGGLLDDPVMSGDVPAEVWKAISDLKDGEYTKEAIKADDAYYIIYRISESDKPKLDDVKDDIKDAIKEKKLDEDADLSITALKALLDKYEFTINDSELEKVYNEYMKIDTEDEEK